MHPIGQHLLVRPTQNKKKETVMKSCIYFLVAALLSTTVARGQAGGAPPVATDSEAGTQVLTRGPVHEAFAATVTFNPEAGIVAPKAAPEAIEELPPERKPEGTNVAWIPGYWAWDDERDDFLWVSGVLRALPPGRQWVSGYWGKSARGSQWTSGYWADAKASEVEYLPEPPDTVEAGPNIAAASVDQIWVPGSWIWNQSRYAWRPGYWATAQPNWVWTPSYYVWAPRGYVYVDGYWDYEVARRGVLFAPVHFDSGIYAQSGFQYSPTTVISLSVFANHLFSRPRYHHYYFGDYYAASYETSGYYPSHSIHSRRHGYDPIYAHQRWQHRQDRDWERRAETQFQNRRDHEDARPPRTWEAQRALARSDAGLREASRMVAATLDELAKSPDGPVQFQPVDKQARRIYAERGELVRKSREERQQLEARAANAAEEEPGQTREPRRGKLSRSPIVAPSVAELGKDQVPPKIDHAPEFDPKVEPKARRATGAVEPPKAEAHPERPTVQPRPDRPRAQPQPERPKAEARPERPRAENRPERPSIDPKAKHPKVEPQPERPKAEPRPEGTKADKPQPSRPKAESRPERPKAERQPERPKAATPQPLRPKAESRPERPNAESRPERPKAETRPQRPQAKQEAPRPRPQPEAKREAPERDPRNEKPARESKGAPKG
jgi:hypothetical protein